MSITKRYKAKIASNIKIGTKSETRKKKEQAAHKDKRSNKPIETKKSK